MTTVSLEPLDAIEREIANEPRDIFYTIPYQMIRVHGALFEGYNRILELIEATPDDKTPPMNDCYNFCGYVYAWAYFMNDHHNNEERYFYPFFEGKIDFAKELDQHKVIHDALGKILAWASKCQKNPSEYSNSWLKTALGEMHDVLQEHMVEEIHDIRREKLSVLPENEVDAMYKIVEDHAKQADPTLTIPYAMGHIPKDKQDFFYDELPFLVKYVVIPIMALRHRGYWKFSRFP